MANDQNASRIIQPGEKAPDISSVDQHEQRFVLSSFRGKKVLLSFHPLAWTPVCAKQMKSLEDNRARFNSSGTVAFGVSVDPVPSKAAWADAIGVKETRLLCDFWPHGALAIAMGVFRGHSGVSERANIIIDENGVVKWSRLHKMEELPEIEEVIVACK